MKAKNIINNVTTTLIILAIAGSAFAGESISDRDGYNFNQPLSTADNAGRSFVYGQEYWQQANALIEDSGEEYDFNRSETKADIAARNYRYNKEALWLIGTEGGDWQYNPARHGNSSLAEGPDHKAGCSKC